MCAASQRGSRCWRKTSARYGEAGPMRALCVEVGTRDQIISRTDSHIELRQRPIQQRLSAESLAQHRPVPTEVVAEIPGRHATAPPVHQPLDLAVVRVHPPKPEATLLP